MAEIIEDGRTGLLFDAGSAQDLAAKVRWADEHPTEMARMGERARQAYEANYTPGHSLRALEEIYAQAMEARWNR